MDTLSCCTQAENILSEIQKLRELIDQSESIILINLDSQRNVMLRLGLQLEMGMFSATLCGLVGMAFGMNLESSLEEVSAGNILAQLGRRGMVIGIMVKIYKLPIPDILCCTCCISSLLEYCDTHTHTQHPYAFWVATGIMFTGTGLLWRRLLMFLGKNLDRMPIKRLAKPKRP